MLSVLQSTVHLPHTYRQIKHLLPAYNNTFVFLAQKEKHVDYLIHCTIDGQILWQHRFSNRVGQMFIMDQKEEVCVVLDVERNYLGTLKSQAQKIEQYYEMVEQRQMEMEIQMDMKDEQISQRLDLNNTQRLNQINKKIRNSPQNRNKSKKLPQRQQFGIASIDLIKKTKTVLPYTFLSSESLDLSIFTFPQRSLFCIKETTSTKRIQFRLTYFKYPIDSQSKSIDRYACSKMPGDLYSHRVRKYELEQWSYNNIIRQANRSSMVCWFPLHQLEQWHWRTYSLDQTFKGQLKKYNIKRQNIYENLLLENSEICLSNMWQAKKGQFMLVCIVNGKEYETSKNIQLRKNYIVNTDKEQTREINLFADEKLSFTDQISLGKYSIWRSYKPIPVKEEKSMHLIQFNETPIYYVSNKKQRVIAENTWVCDFNKYKDEIWGAKSDILILNNYDQENCNWFKSSTISFPLKMKQIIMFFLINIGIDLDEDLMQDVVQMIDYVEEP